MTSSAARERYGFLDVLRGFAILGILLANIPLYAIPNSAADRPYWATASGWREPLAHYITHFFFSLQWLNLFTLLFGVGLALIHRDCTAAGRRFGPVIARRLSVLALIGLAHVALLWMGDILFFYALCGIVAVLLVNRSARTLRRIGIALILVPAVVQFLIGAALLVVQDRPEVRARIERAFPSTQHRAAPVDAFPQMTFRERMKHFGPELEQYTYRNGSFREVCVFRLIVWTFELATVLVYYCWHILGVFLIGMSLAKQGGFIRPEANLRAFTRVGMLGFVLGGALQAASIVLQAGGIGGYAGATFAECFYGLGNLGVSAGYVWLAAVAYARFRDSSLLRCVSAVGRTALSCYITQSVICSLLFCGYGLGWFGRFDRMQLWLVVVPIWALLLLVAPLWLKRFRLGPLEYVWRLLTYGRVSHGT